ncbi:hypothetical protein [Litorilituus sediminis]|uniref:Uncharacterized protein n=1 Tax=Litorilituus sediminis TaxID=718192 RepID=A0A4P6P624_9GAMM|nr:hypothetical protein [Litorilituus sediminis]QBG34862.1 hypothetical protein EMK97_03460 [Litorilituus sediminis]
MNPRQYNLFHLHRAPAFVGFAFIVPAFVEKYISSSGIGLLWSFIFLISSFLTTALLLFMVSFFRVLFNGYLVFRLGAITLFFLTLFPPFVLPLIINSDVLTSFKNALFIVGLLANFLWYSFYCQQKYISKLGWLAKKYEPC